MTLYQTSFLPVHFLPLVLQFVSHFPLPIRNTFNIPCALNRLAYQRSCVHYVCMWNSSKKLRMPSASDALPGRTTAMQVTDRHFVLQHRILPPFENAELALFGLGCFWGAERKFWQQAGVLSTAVGYAAGYTPNPTYEEVCSGLTGHNEVVRVVFDPKQLSFESLLRVFWESHDPTQGMQQGNDAGTQYRSGIYYYNDVQKQQAEDARTAYQAELSRAGYSTITTEILPAPTFYYAEDYHQQYLAKNPAGYCGLGGTGVVCPIGLTTNA
jgi:peptide-methionine (S)-S-oxide reductase